MTSSVNASLEKPRRPSIGMIGVGAFGMFAVKHLSAHFRVVGFDPFADLQPLEARYGICSASLPEAASCDFVVLSMPVKELANVVQNIRPYLRAGSVVLDVCSVKCGPAAILKGLPSHVQVVGTHPLFGPQSGKNGIEGLPIAIVPIRGTAYRIVAAFLRAQLKLRVEITTAENHDRQMAQVQGLTHLISRILLSMPLSPASMTTTAFDHLKAMTELLCRDSDELFHAICAENPYVKDVIRRFLDTSRNVGGRFCGDSEEELLQSKAPKRTNLQPSCSE